MKTQSPLPSSRKRRSGQTSSNQTNTLKWHSLVPRKDVMSLTRELVNHFLAKAGCKYRISEAHLKSPMRVVRLCKFIERQAKLYRTTGTVNVDRYAALSQAAACLKKNVGLVNKASFQKEAADRTFEQCELLCGATNKKLRLWRGDPAGSPVVSVLYAASRKIRHVLGDLPSIDELTLEFGPGSDTLTKLKTTARHKLSSWPSCSPDFLPLVREVYRSCPHYHDLFSRDFTPEGHEYCELIVRPIVCGGSRSTAPKNIQTHRNIMVEPGLNMFLQKGIGRYIRKRLKDVVGLDLKHAQQKHRWLAFEASLGSGLSTLDLSNASDTVSLELVRELLPDEWYDMMKCCRTGTVDEWLDGGPEVGPCRKKVTLLNKFSSMGNGFTFELETLVFWALSAAITQLEGLPGKRVSVYGDDIICPAGAVPRIVKTFSDLGLTVNVEKSFTEGPFFESCGGDYFFGIDVRPVYVKPSVTIEGLRYSNLFYLFNRFSQRDYPAAEVVLSYVPLHIRLFGPIPEKQIEEKFGRVEGERDTTIAGYLYGDDYREVIVASARKRGWSGSFVESYQYVPNRCEAPVRGDTVVGAYLISLRPESSDVSDAVVSMTTPGKYEIAGPPTQSDVLVERCILRRGVYGLKTYARSLDVNSSASDRYAFRGQRGSKKSLIYMLRG